MDVCCVYGCVCTYMCTCMCLYVCWNLSSGYTTDTDTTVNNNGPLNGIDLRPMEPQADAYISSLL